MGNGSTTRGPAKRDMILDAGSKHDRYLQRMIDEEREKAANGRELPAYRDSDSEITANTKGIHLKAVPRWSLGIALVILSIPIGLILVALAGRMAKAAGLLP